MGCLPLPCGMMSKQELFCLRDQFGTKPFYYYETADGELLYGTTIRQIMEQRGL